MLRYVLACALALASPLAFAGKSPTDAQIDRLLELTHSRSMIEGVFGQVETLQKQMFKQSLDGREPTPEEQAKFDRIAAISTRSVREMLTWDRMLPVYHRVYAESLDADDVEAMIAFYETPAGQHVVERMPLIVQKTMGEMQQLMGPAMKQMQEDIAAEVAKMKAEESAAK